MRSMAYMYRDRRTRKRDMRRLWITRINAAARMHGVSYSKLMHAIHTANIDVDRKILAEMAVHDEEAFSALLKVALGTLTTSEIQ
jgi:large subunit ribosomal protein L20